MDNKTSASPISKKALKKSSSKVTKKKAAKGSSRGPTEDALAMDK